MWAKQRFARSGIFSAKEGASLSSVKKACICSICAALCCVLPLAFHAVGLGAAFSPLHLPVLLCALLCGPVYGGFCGLAGAVVSCLLTSMPSPFQLIYMIPEVCTYGVIAGWLSGRVHTGRVLPDLWLSLIPAMLLGRVVGGAVQAVLYLSTAREYSLALWAGGYLAGTLPGAALQLAVLPPLALALMRAGLVPARYPGQRK